MDYFITQPLYFHKFVRQSVRPRIHHGGAYVNTTGLVATTTKAKQRTQALPQLKQRSIFIPRKKWNPQPLGMQPDALSAPAGRLSRCTVLYYIHHMLMLSVVHGDVVEEGDDI